MRVKMAKLRQDHRQTVVRAALRDLIQHVVYKAVQIREYLALNGVKILQQFLARQVLFAGDIQRIKVLRMEGRLLIFIRIDEPLVTGMQHMVGMLPDRHIAKDEIHIAGLQANVCILEKVFRIQPYRLYQFGSHTVAPFRQNLSCSDSIIFQYRKQSGFSERLQQRPNPMDEQKDAGCRQDDRHDIRGDTREHVFKPRDKRRAAQPIIPPIHQKQRQDINKII